MPNTDNIRTRAIRKLIERRKALQDAYDALVAEPQSFGISGSVNATNQRLSDLRVEIAAIDSQIAGCMQGASGFMTIIRPDYRWGAI